MLTFKHVKFINPRTYKLTHTPTVVQREGFNGPHPPGFTFCDKAQRHNNYVKKVDFCPNLHEMIDKQLTYQYFRDG